MSKTAAADESSSRLSAAVPCKSDPVSRDGSAKSLADVLAALPAPPGGLKRKHSSDGPSTFTPPSKVLRPGRRALKKITHSDMNC